MLQAAVKIVFKSLIVRFKSLSPCEDKTFSKHNDKIENGIYYSALNKNQTGKTYKMYFLVQMTEKVFTVTMSVTLVRLKLDSTLRSVSE